MTRNLPATTDNNRPAGSYFPHTTKGRYEIEISSGGLKGTRHGRHRATRLDQQPTTRLDRSESRFVAAPFAFHIWNDKLDQAGRADSRMQGLHDQKPTRNH
jgi:hypothetical protein